MADEYLTTREFARWCEDDRDFKYEMRAGMRAVVDKDSMHGERLTALETDFANIQPASRSTSIKWGAGVTTVLTIIIQAALAAFGVGSK